MSGRTRHASWDDLQKTVSLFLFIQVTYQHFNFYEHNSAQSSRRLHCFLDISIIKRLPARQHGVTFNRRSMEAIYSSFLPLAITPSTRAAATIVRARNTLSCSSRTQRTLQLEELVAALRTVVSGQSPGELQKRGPDRIDIRGRAVANVA